MDIKYYKSGDYSNQYGYMSFYPNPIDGEWNMNIPEINILLEEASLKLGELNAFSSLLTDPDVFINMFLIKEALQSSGLEGNRISLEEFLLPEKEVDPEHKDNCRAVENCIAAMKTSINELEEQSISSDLLKEIHKIYLNGLESKNNITEGYRTNHCWVGGDNIKDAVFVPPHHAMITECVNDLLKFLSNDDISVPRLIRIGIAHYQFETIHSFLKGNGCVGRILIMLYLKEQKVLYKPVLYLSDYFIKNKPQYFDNLLAVSLNNKMAQWLKFFLTGVIETSKNVINTFIKINILNDKLDKMLILVSGKRLPNAKLLLAYLYNNPVATVTDIVAGLNVTKQTANVLISDFYQWGILKEQTGNKRNRIFVFQEFLDLFI